MTAAAIGAEPPANPPADPPADPAAGHRTPPEPPHHAPVPPAVEPTPPDPEELLVARPIVLELNARGELGFNADLRDEPGNVTITRLGTGFNAAIPVQRFAQFDVGIDYEFSHYRFNDATGFVAGVESPWENIHRETLTLRFYQQQSLRLGWFVGGAIGLAHEEGASMSDSVLGGGFGGFRFAVTERIFVGAGLAVWNRLEQSPLVVPVPSIDLRLSDQVRLTTAGRLGLTLAYDASENLTFSLDGEYDLREFRLSSSGPVPDGVGQDRRVPITASVVFAPTRQLSITVAGGAYLNQRFKLLDSAGRELADMKARPTPFASLQLSYKF